MSGPYGPNVRLMSRIANKLVVEVRDPQAPTGWRPVEGGIIDDLGPKALLEATLLAQRTRATLLEGENV